MMSRHSFFRLLLCALFIVTVEIQSQSWYALKVELEDQEMVHADQVKSSILAAVNNIRYREAVEARAQKYLFKQSLFNYLPAFGACIFISIAWAAVFYAGIRTEAEDFAAMGYVHQAAQHNPTDWLLSMFYAFTCGLVVIHFYMLLEHYVLKEASLMIFLALAVLLPMVWQLLYHREALLLYLGYTAPSSQLDEFAG